MLQPEYIKQFKKDLKTLAKRNVDLDLLKEIIELLCNKEKLAEKYNDHPLSGDWQGCRDCHIKPDWILIYQIGNEMIVFERTGSHSDLF